MEANPALPAVRNGRSKVVNAASAPALVAPNQIAIANTGLAVLLPKWRAALAKVRASNGSAKVLCIGDGSTFGIFSNGTSTGDLKPKAYPTKLAAFMNSAGTNAHANSFMGTGTGSAAGDSASTDVDDARVVMGAGWTHAGLNSVGGSMFTASSATSALSFLPTVNVDTFDIYYRQYSGGGVFAYNFNGAGGGTQTTNNATDSVVKATVSTTLGSNTLNLNYSSGSGVYIVGVVAYDSTKNWVDVINAGWPLSQALDWAVSTNGYSPCNTGISGVAPDLTIINLGVSDVAQVEGIGAYIANVQKIITAAQATGDVLLVSQTPVSVTATYPQSTQAQYAAALYALAAKNNVPLLDLYSRWVSYTLSNANGLMGSVLYPNAVGYSDMAAAIFNFVGNP